MKGGQVDPPWHRDSIQSPVLLGLKISMKTDQLFVKFLQINLKKQHN